MLKKSLCSAIVILIVIACAGPKELSRSGKEIPSKTNRIYINTDDSLNSAFRRFGNILQMEGFSIESSDQDLGSIKTSQKTLHSSILGGKVKATLYASVMKKADSTMIQLRGTCYWGQDAENDGPIRLYGQETSPLRRCWGEMYSMAKKYKGAKLEFDTK